MPAKTRGVSSSSKVKEPGSVIASLKSSLSALRPHDQSKITKPATKSKAVTERQRLKRTVEQLSAIKEGIGFKPSSFSSSDELQRDTISSSCTAKPHTSQIARDLEIDGKLGRGKFGREKLVHRDIKIHQNLARKNILKLLSWFHDDKYIYLFLKFAPGGSLYSKLNKQPEGRFSEYTTATYIAQMAEALRYMQSKNGMHRDIKPDNMLLGLHSEIKLADLGWSLHSESEFQSTVCGTLDYLSPEVAIMMLKSRDLGVLMYELLMGKLPFELKSGKATQKKITSCKGKGLKFPGHVSKGAEQLIRELLNLDAEKRMSLDEVLTHPWIVEHVGNPAHYGTRSINRMLQQQAT
ncbi:serine/threonine-protein kinase 12 [Clathrospora elynae]|uniref:Serine/threonine-protein kinase 12 n=1 Tax=Clathrospora elynae TaxID=706981 RepID=A0A6A5SJJ7_9PLEO|nr:serine/threonine-protein kinase 12 [Clathrospora elynae]